MWRAFVSDKVAILCRRLTDLSVPVDNDTCLPIFVLCGVSGYKYIIFVINMNNCVIPVCCEILVKRILLIVSVPL